MTTPLQEATRQLDEAYAAYAAAYAQLDALIEAGIEDGRYSQAVDAQIAARQWVSNAEEDWRRAQFAYLTTPPSERGRHSA